MARDKSLLRTVKTWFAGATEEGAIHLKDVELPELIEGFYPDKATNTVLAPQRFSETYTNSTGKYRTLLLSPQWNAEV